MRSFLTLFRWELRESFGIGSLNKKSGKAVSWLKISVMQLIMIALFGYIFTLLMSGPRAVLEAVGRPGLFMVVSFSLAGFVLFLGSMAQAILNWDWGGDRAWIMTQPLPTGSLFLSKILAVGIMLSANATGILFHWALVPGTGFSVQVFGLVAMGALCAALALSAISHILISLAMSLGRRFLSKDKLTVVLAVVGIAGGIGIQIILNSALQGLSPEKVTGWLATWGEWLRPAEDLILKIPFWTLPAAALALLTAAVPLSTLYIRSIAGDTGRGSGATQSKPAQVSGLFTREFFLLWREPMYMLNGPLVLFILPFLMWIMAAFNIQAIQDSLKNIQNTPSVLRDFLPLTMAGFTLFLGVLSGMAATAVSREGPGLAWLRSLPVEPKRFLQAKWNLSMTFFVISVLVLFLPMSLIGLFSGLYSFTIWAVSAALLINMGSLINWLSLILDTARPYLSWDQPVAAVKTNVNVLIQIGGLIVVLVGIGLLTPFFFGNALNFIFILNALVAVGILAAAGPGMAWAARRWVSVPI